jgi:aryl-alcohol dehydrogenase-like predicted oxidoreductase
VLAVPPIGLGTWQTFDVGRSPAARAPLAAVLREFVELGGTLIDSSPMYGRAEEVVGELATSLGIRDRLFIATKVWTEGRAAGIAQMDESIRKLGGRVDLMQVHNLVDADAHLDTLQTWKSEGRVRSIGITHYTSSGYRGLRKYIERGGIDVVQLNYSVAEREAERELLPLCRERNLAVLANRPLGSGALIRRAARMPLPPFAKGMTWPELLLRFVISHDAITCAIPATANVEHLRENLRAAHGAPLDDAQRAELIELF